MAGSIMLCRIMSRYFINLEIISEAKAKRIFLRTSKRVKIYFLPEISHEKLQSMNNIFLSVHQHKRNRRAGASQTRQTQYFFNNFLFIDFLARFSLTLSLSLCRCLASCSLSLAHIYWLSRAFMALIFHSSLAYLKRITFSRSWGAGVESAAIQRIIVD